MLVPFSIRSAPVVLAMLLAIGCGAPSAMQLSPDDNPTFGLHDGPVAALPGGGTVEVVAEPEAELARLVTYFYASDAMDAPLAPAPTDVRIDLKTPGGETMSVTLAPGTGTEARFVSDPGDYQIDPLIGTLKATIDGQAISVRFSGAHF